MKGFWFHPEALEEAAHAALFYKEQQAGLDKRFLEALEDTVARIRRCPLLYRRAGGDIRKCRLLRFPYGVIYRFRNDQVEIIAVMHLKRKPGYWKRRG